jgi:hypothetical protein
VGQYYRHAVGQAVLYRDFIRRATPLEPWFEQLDMNHRSCQAAVALTPPPGANWKPRLLQVQKLGLLFNVKVAVI